MNVLVTPGYAAFRLAYEAGRGSLVWRKTVADLETPVAAFLKLAHGQANSFLLESVEGGAARGRYSVIGLQPDLIWRCQDGKASVNRHALSAPHAFLAETKAPLDSLRALIAQTQLDVPAHLPPMSGGLVGYLGYDMVRQMETLPANNPDVIGVPEGIMVRPTLFAIFDNVNDELTLVTPAYPAGDVPVETAWQRAHARLDAAETALERPLPHQPPPVMLPDPPAPSSNFSKEAFIASVARCKEYIAAGDAFQIVLSQRFSVPFALPPFALYRALRRINPAPFLFYLDFGGFSIVGSSPEVLVRLRDGIVTVRPLAGTRRRGATHEEDQALEAELLSDPKEQAEHLMLLDLGRNDVERGRPVARRAGCAGCANRRVSSRDVVWCAKGACDGDHRDAGTGPAQHLWRLHRLFCRQWGDGYLHRVADGAGQGRGHACAGRRRRRGRLGRRSRIRGDATKGSGAGAGGGGSGAVRGGKGRGQCGALDHDCPMCLSYGVGNAPCDQTRRDR
jgi:anthranilate synthase component 1